MLLALWWRVRHKLLGIHLAPVHLCAGKGPTGTLNTGGMLDDFNLRARIHQPPHQAEVAPRHGLLRPQPNYEALHGLFGRLTTRDMSFSHQGDRLLKVQNWSLLVYCYQHHLVASWWL